MIVSKTRAIILASSSETRWQILRNAGVAVDRIPPRVDEEKIKREMIDKGAGGAEIAEVLAKQKALSVSCWQPHDLVIGADQILEMDGRIFSKPRELTSARETLVLLRGREHRLFSCVCVARDGQWLWHKLDSAKLSMRKFSDKFLDDYLCSIGTQALAGPGSYQIEDVGSQLFSRITGDHFTILGMPLIPLLDYLRVQGVLQS